MKNRIKEFVEECCHPANENSNDETTRFANANFQWQFGKT